MVIWQMSNANSTALCVDSLSSMSSKPSSVANATGPMTMRTPPSHLEHVLLFQQQILLGDLRETTLPKVASSIDMDSPWEDQATMGYQYSVVKQSSGCGLSGYYSIATQQYPKSLSSTMEFPPFGKSPYAHQGSSRSAPNLLAGTKWRIPTFKRRSSYQNSLHRCFEITTCMKLDPLARDRRSALLNDMRLYPLSIETSWHQVGTSLPITKRPLSIETIRFAESTSETPDVLNTPGEPITDYDFVSTEVKSAPNGSHISSKRKRLAKQLRRFKSAINRVLA